MSLSKDSRPISESIVMLVDTWHEWMEYNSAACDLSLNVDARVRAAHYSESLQRQRTRILDGIDELIDDRIRESN